MFVFSNTSKLATGLENMVLSFLDLFRLNDLRKYHDPLINIANWYLERSINHAPFSFSWRTCSNQISTNWVDNNGNDHPNFLHWHEGQSWVLLYTIDLKFNWRSECTPKIRFILENWTEMSLVPIESANPNPIFADLLSASKDGRCQSL